MTDISIPPAFNARTDLPLALVVGAGGMSMTVAQRLGQDHRLILASLGAEELERGASRLRELGVVTGTIRCNITLPESARQLGSTVAALGRVQSLAHVAGLSPSMSDGPTILAVNLIGAALIEEVAGPLMAPGGAAVFISSMAAHFIAPPPEVLNVLDQPLAPDLQRRLETALGTGLTPEIAYPLSKRGLNRLVQRQAAAWGRRGSRLVSVSPGLIDTPMGALESTGDSWGQRGSMRSQLPLQRDGSMSEIADVVAFLLSRRASYITGTDLLVDGGITAALGVTSGNQH